ncbi:hypothetical protein OKW40_007034 [Paraburkholderia sp. RAU6.4a]|uniref:cytochrome ubiquinol oxidase subunit I n=1 Tax=Paraburkholderia sp. RAU6.4a TaxID=2991067 RepID=UPI003D1BC440
MSGRLSLPCCDGNCCSSVQAVLHSPWIGTAAAPGRRLQKQRWLLWPVAWSFPLGFIAILAGWFTAEVGRQPWAVWGVLRTANALTPGLSAHFAVATLALYVAVYGFIFCFGIYYILRIVMSGVTTGEVIGFWNGNAIFQIISSAKPFPRQRQSPTATLGDRADSHW